jgi:hypothetical protein
MKLTAAVDTYVLHRRAMGQKCDGPAIALRAFSRRCGSKHLQGITPSEVKQFLDVPQTGPAAWLRKYGVLWDFFTYCRLQLPSTRKPSSHISTPVGSFVCCWTQRRVVSDMRRAGHPQLRFAPCCCSSTERV